MFHTDTQIFIYTDKLGNPGQGDVKDKTDGRGEDRDNTGPRVKYDGMKWDETGRDKGWRVKIIFTHFKTLIGFIRYTVWKKQLKRIRPIYRHAMDSPHLGMELLL